MAQRTLLEKTERHILERIHLMKISEMKVGQMVNERLVLAGAEVRKTKGNQPSNYLSMSITDGTDVLDGKVWPTIESKY